MKYQLDELSIELSQRCACRCIMCSSGASPRAGPNELSPTEIAALISQARELGATTLSLSGGDPLLQYENAEDYITQAMQLGYHEVLFYTTGISMSHKSPLGFGECADFLLAIEGPYLRYLLAILEQLAPDGHKDIVKFVFSLHSHRAATHDYIMGLTGAFSATCRSIQRVVGEGYSAWVHMVPMLPNWQHVRRLRDMCGELGVEKMSLLRYVPQTRGRTNRRMLGLTKGEFQDLQSIMCDMAYRHSSQPEHPVQLRYGCPIDFRHTVDSCIVDKAKPCHAGTDLMLVRPDGSVHPCAAWKTLPDDSNVRKQSLKDIWESGDVFQAIRKFREDGWTNMGGPCSMCSYLGSCKGGCPAQKLHWLGLNITDHVSINDIEWPMSDPMCPIGTAEA